LPSLKHCPAYEGSREGGPAATFGTAFHKAVETGEVKHALTEEALEAAKEGQNYTEVEIEAAYVWAIEFIAGLEEKYKPKMSVTEVQGDLEGRRFFIDHLLVIMGAEANTAIVIDWKTGRMVKDAQTDPQGLAYVRFMLGNENLNVDKCAMIFAHPFVESYSNAAFDREMLPKIHEELEAIIVPAKKKNAEERPGEGCKYCGKHPCAAVSKQITAVAEGAIDMDQARKDPERMAELRDLVIPLEKFVKAIKAAANAMRFEDGLELPGYSTRFTSPRKRVEDTASVVAHLQDSFENLDVEHILSYCSPSLKDIQSIISDCVATGERGEVYATFLAHCQERGWISNGDGEGSAYLIKCK